MSDEESRSPAVEQGPVVIISTFDSEESAKRACKRLLIERLIAGANLVADAPTMYLDAGEIQHGFETIVLMRTLVGKVPEILAVVDEIEPSGIELTVIPVAQEQAAYLRWLSVETEVVGGGGSQHAPLQ